MYTAVGQDLSVTQAWQSPQVMAIAKVRSDVEDFARDPRSVVLKKLEYPDELLGRQFAPGTPGGEAVTSLLQAAARGENILSEKVITQTSGAVAGAAGAICGPGAMVCGAAFRTIGSITGQELYRWANGSYKKARRAAASAVEKCMQAGTLYQDTVSELQTAYYEQLREYTGVSGAYLTRSQVMEHLNTAGAIYAYPSCSLPCTKALAAGCVSPDEARRLADEMTIRAEASMASVARAAPIVLQTYADIAAAHQAARLLASQVAQESQAQASAAQAAAAIQAARRASAAAAAGSGAAAGQAYARAKQAEAAALAKRRRIRNRILQGLSIVAVLSCGVVIYRKRVLR